MKIALLTLQYSPLSESFVRREAEGLQARGHDVVAFTKRDPDGPLPVSSSVEARPWTDANLHAFAPDVLYASLGMPAHRRTAESARALKVPYILRCWQGYDMFCNPSPEFYRAAVADPRCLAIVVEDDFARHYAAVEMQASGEKVRVVPNGVDTALFTPVAEREGPTLDFHGTTDRPLRVLAIARFVRKKGLAHLCAAWRALRPPGAELIVIGYGPEEENLRAAAGLSSGVTFLPPIPPTQLASEYHAADIFAAPCIAVKGGDADGVPTTVLEAMACGLPILGSALHSMPLYVEHDVSGLLTTPGDERAIGEALARLLDDTDLRQRLGAQARRAAVERFSLSASLESLEAILSERPDRGAHWRAGVDAMAARRATYTPERLAYYDRIGRECLAILQPVGSVLDVGCGDASMRETLRECGATHYLGVDPSQVSSPWTMRGVAERLPVSGPFDTVLLYSVLQHVEDPAAALAEARRVLRPGGRLAMQVCVADANPLFMWHWQPAEVIALVEAAGFVVEHQAVLEGRLLCVRGRRR